MQGGADKKFKLLEVESHTVGGQSDGGHEDEGNEGGSHCCYRDLSENNIYCIGGKIVWNS